jgi:soluble lytic murein transglycosylase
MPHPLPLLAISLALTPSLGCAATPPPAPPPASAPVTGDIEVPPELSRLALDLPAPVLADLLARRWDAAATGLAAVKPAEDQKPELAFVRAWALVQAERAAEAAPLLPLLEQASDAPAAYVALIRGEILRSAGAPEKAVGQLEAVPTDSYAWGAAQVARAAALTALGRPKESLSVLRGAAERPDPAPFGDRVLAALAVADPEVAPAIRRRLWREYPRTKAEIAVRDLPMPAATWRDAARRAEVRSGAGDHGGAVADLTPFVAKVDDLASLDACRFRYAHGRALYRQNQLTAAVTAFADAGARCVGGPGADYGAKILYLLGTDQFRRKQFAASADAFRHLAADYPTHSMADDGLLHGGISLQESGDLAAAQAMWRDALARYPTGDTAPEASWRLAWSLYLQGKTDAAIAAADALGALDPTADALDVGAGQYWAARWRMYPDVANPRAATADPARRAAALDGWEALCRRLPHGFYAIEAYSRLVALAPERAAALAKRPDGHDTGAPPHPWVVRREFFDDPQIRDGLALARVGLGADAQASWNDATIAAEDRTPDEVAWLAGVRAAAGDWLRVHDELRTWLKTHAIATLGPRAPQIVRLVYPDRYLPEVRAAVLPTYAVPSRLFHALCREESNFNAAIVSHAGAIGLSQLMPATATQTAGWLGLKVTTSQLDDPALNAKIGAKYLDTVYRQHDKSPYLALAAYNAGAGRTKEWRTAWGDVPTDEYVERIPFRETRDYVKRVMGTWQTYRYQFDVEDPAFPDLSALVDHAWAEP